MRYIFLSMLFLTFSAHAELLWKPEGITFSIKQPDRRLGIGLTLEINQKLLPGESGWEQFRIDIPQNWEKAKLEMRQGTFFIIVDDKEYFLDASNIGGLNQEIFDGGKKTDEQLLIIWWKHARFINEY